MYSLSPFYLNLLKPYCVEFCVVRLSADRVYPGFGHISSSSNDVDATSVHLLSSEKTGRRSAEGKEWIAHRWEDREEIIISTSTDKYYSVFVSYITVFCGLDL